MTFDQQHGILSTFFVSVSKGYFLSYGVDSACLFINRIKARGFDVGVHGISFDSQNDMAKEHRIFAEISGLKSFGIRIHYLRRAPNTISYLSEIGYNFDSSEYELKHPRKYGQLWEFPLHVMDGYIICKGSGRQRCSLEQAQLATLDRLEMASKAGIRYFTLLFHDRYFSDEFKTWKNWYIWFVEYCKENGYAFINYQDAISELEGLLL